MDSRTASTRSGLAPSLWNVTLLLMILAILIGSLSTLGAIQYFDRHWKTIALQAALEDQVSQALQQMQIQELQYSFNVEYARQPDTSLEDAAVSAGQVQAGLEQFIQQGQAQKLLNADQTAQAQAVLAALEAHQQTFAAAVQLYEAADLDQTEDWEQVTTKMDTVRQENEALQEDLQELIFSLDAARSQTEQEFPAKISLALRGSGAAAIILIILALVGYRSIGRLVQPLLALSIAVIAIGGDRYHPALLENIRGDHSQAGRLARELEAFARAIEQRDAGLKGQIDDLRRQFYEARRRRMKVSSSSQSKEP